MRYNSKMSMAMWVINNDMRAKGINSMPSAKYSWLVKYICNKCNKDQLQDIYNRTVKLSDITGMTVKTEIISDKYLNY